MHLLIGSLMAVGNIVAGAEAYDGPDQVLAAWEESQRDIKSLRVEFTREFLDRVFNTTYKADGVFRLVRTPEGKIHATYDLGPEKPKGGTPGFSCGMLNGRTVFILEPEQKLEKRINLAEKDLPVVLEDCFNPLVILLDRKRAEETYILESKRDEFYTYLSLKPKMAKRSGWFTFSMRQGRVVLMNNDSHNVPKGMPCQLWFVAGNNQEFKFDIKTWRMNAVDGPKVEDFTRPDSRPGWKVEVVDWPLKTPGEVLKK